jgi:hypothetical protein
MRRWSPTRNVTSRCSRSALACAYLHNFVAFQHNCTQTAESPQSNTRAHTCMCTFTNTHTRTNTYTLTRFTIVPPIDRLWPWRHAGPWRHGDFCCTCDLLASFRQYNGVVVACKRLQSHTRDCNRMHMASGTKDYDNVRNARFARRHCLHAADRARAGRVCVGGSIAGGHRFAVELRFKERTRGKYQARGKDRARQNEQQRAHTNNMGVVSTMHHFER